MGLLTIGWPVRAQASNVRIRSRTVAEGYAVQSAVDPSLLLRRRRLAQYVSLGVYEMLPPREVDQLRRDPEDGQLRIAASMRLRHDFGNFRSGAGSQSGPTLEALDGRQIDLMFGYLEGQKLGDGWVDFKLGRQFEQSGLDWYAFDGGFVRIRLPVHVGIEAFSGLTVRGDDIFGYPTFELDGTRDRASDRALSPMVGVAASVIDSRWLSGRVAYRRVFSPGRSRLGEDQAPLESGVDQELVSASLGASLWKGKVAPHGAIRLDLAGMRVSDLSAGVYWELTERHRLRTNFLRTRPTFDLDSIFNVFSARAFEDLRVTWEVDTNPRWTVAARGQARWFHASETAGGTAPRSATTPNGGAGLSAAYRRRRVAFRLDTHGLTGEGGTQWGAAADARTFVWHNRVAVDLRAYGVRYADDRPDTASFSGRSGWAFATQAGFDARLWRGVHLSIMGEEMFSALLANSFRMWAVLAADWNFRGGLR